MADWLGEGQQTVEESGFPYVNLVHGVGAIYLIAYRRARRSLLASKRGEESASLALEGRARQEASSGGARRRRASELHEGRPRLRGARAPGRSRPAPDPHRAA